MRAPDVSLVDNDISGYWKIIARPIGEEPVDITVVRGAPTAITTMTFLDPFGPAEATLYFPGVTMLDTFGPGTGDLAWLRPEVDVDIVWEPTSDALQLSEKWPRLGGRTWLAWEGYAINFGWSFADASGALTMQLRGAMFQLDNYLAMQEYLSRPITFENAIARQFRNKPGLRLSYPRVLWPEWWRQTYDIDFYSNQPLVLRPTGVIDGENWTGMLTRETGQREEVLSSYIQGLLSAMFTERGQWTLMLNPGRVPVLRHRDMSIDPTEADLYVDALQPGLQIELDQDWTQRANVVYGRGRSLAGVTFSGMQVTPSGSRTYYRPFAAMDAVHPEDPSNNPAFDIGTMRKEINLDFYEGMTANDAEQVAKDHMRRFSDPGVTGTLTFTGSDPRAGDSSVVFPRHLIQAGLSIRVDGLFGRRPGPVFNVAQAEVSPDQNTATLTVDTRFRDWVTVNEVIQRGRDSLQVARMLTVGQYQPNIPDQLLPWDYNIGSGAIPLGSKNYFNGAPDDLEFPWTDWVRDHPPSRFGSSFIKVGKVDNRNATNNWNRKNARSDSTIAPLLLSQAGQIKLLQVAAFRANGEPAKVAFHLGIYADYAVSAQDMPALPNDYDAGRNRRYSEGDYYPFFPDAFEQINAEGEQYDDQFQMVAQGAAMVVAYGTSYAKAGYWPVGYDPDVPATGMLVDESGFSYDGTQHPDWDPTDRSNNTFEESGRFGVLIYCDDQGNEPVYFLGRAWLRELGTQ